VTLAFEDTLEGTIAALEVQQEIRGTGYGVLATVNGVGDLFSSTLIRIIWSVAGAAAEFWVAAALCVSGTIMLAIARPLAQARESVRKDDMPPVIGIVGGLGPEGTVHYYRKVAQHFASIPLNEGRPGIVIDHVWIDCFSSLLRAGDEHEVVRLLAASLERIHRAGADLAMIAAVTPHKFLPALRQSSPLPIVDIVSATQRHVLAARYATVGLVGTRVTLTEPFFKQPLEEAGIRVVLPDEDGISYLNDLIFGALASGTKTDGMKQAIREVLRRMTATARLDALVVACTDLMDLIETPIALVDPIDCHVRLAAQLLEAHVSSR